MIDCHAELACLHRAVSAEAGFGILHHFFLDAELIPINIGTAWRVFMILNRYLLGRETDNHKISRSNSKSIKVIADQQLKG